MKHTGTLALSSLALRFAIGFVLVCFGATGAVSDDDRPLEIRLSYSNAAKATLTRLSEEVVVLATYFVAASPAGMTRSEGNGAIPLGSDTVQVGPAEDAVALSPDDLSDIDPALTQGPIQVNVNVFSARLSGEDNILACDFYEGDLESLRSAGIDLQCFLITENEDTESKP